MSDMEITKAMIEQRLADYRKDLANLQATVNAISGAVQDCEFWLAELEKKSEKK